MSNYLKIHNFLYSPEHIEKIDCRDIEKMIVYVYIVTGNIITVEGLDAINIVMDANPAMIEGKRFKFKKGMWIIHNMIAHPVMQILALLRCYKIAMWVHDVTIPKPIDRKK